MNVLEFEAKALLNARGIAVPPGTTITQLSEAAQAVASIGGAMVVKAQVPIGGRMKAGGIRFAQSPQEAAAAAGELLGTAIRGFPVDAVLIEAKLDVAAEARVAADTLVFIFARVC